jgi:hypothetical protein
VTSVRSDSDPGRPPGSVMASDSSSFDMVPFDMAPFDMAPFDMAPFDMAPFDMAPVVLRLLGMRFRSTNPKM